jgi:anti-anti-sigma factor
MLDAFSEPIFRKVVAKYLEEGPANIILDLSRIDFVDSSGVGALVQVAKLVQGQSGTLHLVGNARVTQTLKLVRLDKFLPQKASVEEALEAAKAAQSES